MKKVLIIVISIILLTAVFYSLWGRDIYYNMRDREYWMELSSRITDSQIEEVILYSLDRSVMLEGYEFKKFISDLSESKYYRSNWRMEGPTGPLITIKFIDGSTENFQYWGKGIYETLYKKGQFLIQNLELDVVINKYGINDSY